MDEDRGASLMAAALVVGVVILLAFLFEMSERPSLQDFPQETQLRARDLVRRALDAGSSAEQDTDAIMAIAHATEATTLLQTARELMPLGALNAVCGNIDVVAQTERFHAVREAAARAMRPRARAPTTAPASTALPPTTTTPASTTAATPATIPATTSASGSRPAPASTPRAV